MIACYKCMILGTCLLLWNFAQAISSAWKTSSFQPHRFETEHGTSWNPEKKWFALSWKMVRTLGNCHEIAMFCFPVPSIRIVQSSVGGFQFCLCCNPQPDPASWLVAHMVMSSQLSFGVSNFEFRLWPQVQPPKKRTEYLITHWPVAETLLSTCLNSPNPMAFSLDQSPGPVDEAVWNGSYV